MYYQICFKITNPDLINDGEEDEIFGGIGKYAEICGEDILTEVICGCCGSVLDPTDIKVLEKYDSWVDLTETIIGETQL